MTLLFFLALAFLGVQFVTLVTNLFFFPVLKPTSRTCGSETVSLLVPARNEAETLPQTLPRLLSQAAEEVIVLNDQSTDTTPEVLASFDAPQLRVLQGEPLPAGWSGKNWACHQLFQAARGDILIFTDADVCWEGDTLAALLAFREREGADYVSIWPRQITKTFAERATVPVIDLILLGSLPYLGVRYLAAGAFSAGNGQLMLFHRAAYARLGGHAAFKEEVLEDVRMGQAAKALGIRTALALGGNLLSTRMYRNFPGILEGFSKNILAAVGNRPLALVLLGCLSTLAYTLPWVLGFVEARWFWLGLLGLSLRALTTLKTRRSVLETPLQPLLPFPLWRISFRALRRGGRYTWKGREYG